MFYICQYQQNASFDIKLPIYAVWSVLLYCFGILWKERQRSWKDTIQNKDIKSIVITRIAERRPREKGIVSNLSAMPNDLTGLWIDFL